MKTRLVPLVCGIAAIAIASVWDSGAPAQTPAPGAPAPAVETPLGLRCVVTLDPWDSGDPAAPISEVRRSSGFNAPNTSEGTLVRLDAEWLVLRDGNYDNWIPRNKVLVMRSAR